MFKKHIRNYVLAAFGFNIIVILLFLIFSENKFLYIRNFIFMEFIILELIYFYILVKNPNRLALFLIVLLPINTLLNIISFHFFSISGRSLDVFKAWKDILLLFALFYWGRNLIKHQVKINFRDNKVILFTALFAFIEIIYILLPIGPASLLQKVYSFRTDTIYLFFFILGILIPKLDVNKIMKGVLYTAIIFSIIALVERVFSPLNLLVWLGMPDYTLYMTGGLPHTQGGISYTYWAVGGLRRVGSLLLNPLDFAAFSLFALPTVFILKDIKKRILAISLLGIGIICTLSRMPIMIMILFVLGLFLIKFKQFKKLFILGASAVTILGILIFALVSKFRSYVINTITFKEPSAQGHLHDWLLAINNLSRHPFGMGLATSGSAGARYGNFGGGENQYLILGVQLGWIGVAIFIAMLVSILVFLFKTYKESQLVNLWLGSTVLFLMISGITQQSFLNITITCVTFLSLGFIIKERV